MPEPCGQTGNPVFDFRAKCRVRANMLQNGLLLAGVVEIFIGLFELAFTDRPYYLRWIVVGAALVAGAVAWGFFWRVRLRTEFRKEFATEDTENSEGKKGL